jgi:hypothetical protein
MEPEGLLPCSQEPSIGPYPEPDRSVHTVPNYLSNIHFNMRRYFPPKRWLTPHLHGATSQKTAFLILILFAHLRRGLPSGLFPSGFPGNIIYALSLSSIRATCRAHLILLDLITLIILGEEVSIF